MEAVDATVDHHDGSVVREWLDTEPGVCVLVGTQFRVRYLTPDSGEFCVYQGDRLRGWTTSLADAKMDCELFQSELESTGGAGVEAPAWTDGQT